MMLIGACPEAFGMVYEFLPNGSLEDQLSCKKNTPPLTWKMRTRIIGEICSALTFIHSQKPHPVVHGNLNPMNILLDANFVSKLHVCQLLRKYNTGNNTSGTSSYIDPEFLSTGELAPRCDVYSFGIIILRRELALRAGQPACASRTEMRQFEWKAPARSHGGGVGGDQASAEGCFPEFWMQTSI